MENLQLLSLQRQEVFENYVHKWYRLMVIWIFDIFLVMRFTFLEIFCALLDATILSFYGLFVQAGFCVS